MVQLIYMTGLYINGMEPNHCITFNLRCLVRATELFISSINFLMNKSRDILNFAC